MVFFDRILFCVLLAVLAARPLISETFQPLEVSFLEALENTGGPTPATTAWLDWITLAAAVLALARQQRWRRHAVAGLGIVLLAVAVGLSLTAAGDKPTALLAGANLVVAALAAVALGALVETRAMRNLLVAALLATGATSGVKCLKQQFSENPLVQQEWEAVYKPKLIAQGFDPQDPLFVNFERRMKAGEVYGFLGHPNIEASCLMMWLLVAGGVLGGWWAGLAERPNSPGSLRPTRRLAADRPGQSPAATFVGHRLSAGVGVALCLMLALALAFTRSRGAILAGSVGLMALFGLSLTGAWVGRHARRVLGGLIAGYIALVAVGLTYGLTKGTLPTASMAFRWQYWTAAARALRDAPLTGLGRENFAYAYMLYKTPEATEEVKNPHNLWVSLLVELGPLGLITGTALCGASLLAGLRNLGPARAAGVSTVGDEGTASGIPRRPRGADVTRPGQSPAATGRASAAAVAVGVVSVHALFSGMAFGNLGDVIVWVQDILLPWVLAFAAAVWMVTGSESKRGDRWLVAGLCAALLAAFVHGLVDFALLTPGGLAVFVLCAAGCGQTRSDAEPQPVRGATLLPVIVASILLATYSLMAPWALDSAGVLRSKARAVLQAGRTPTQWVAERENSLARAAGLAEQAVARNPLDTNNYILLATTLQELSRVCAEKGGADDARRTWSHAAEVWQRAVERYPTNPRTRISCGKAWFEIWKQSGDADAARSAREHLTKALRIDDTRPIVEVVRLRSKEREAVTECLRALP